MSFRNDLPNYKSYSEDEYIMNTCPPPAFWTSLSGLILRIANKEIGIKPILDDFAEIIPCEPTRNWGYDYLKNDISDFLFYIRKKVENGRFDILMDCLAAMIIQDKSVTEEINEFIEEHEIGYYFVNDYFTKKGYWEKRDIVSVIDDIDETKQMIKSVSQQAYEEYKRAVITLEDADTERARKDAVRSCVSAMEAVIKEYGQENEIGKATKSLLHAKIWGLDEIVKEGNSIFNTMHRLYPDLRHGSTDTSTMTLEEAEYWIGRISNFLKYMKKMADKNTI